MTRDGERSCRGRREHGGSRRRFLQAAGAAGLTAVLAGCSGGDGGTPTGTEDDDADGDDGGADGTDTVDPAHFAVGEFEPGDLTMGIGDRFDVGATIENTGDESGERTVQYRVDDDPIETETVTLAGGDAASVGFDDVETDGFGAGTHVHEVYTGDESAGGTLRLWDPEVRLEFEEGAYHFLNDPRPFRADGRTFMGWTNNDTEVVVYQLDHATGETETVRWDSDLPDGSDHNNPSLLELDDGRLIAFYDRSSDIHYRMTSTPHDITTFGEERSISASDDYATAVQLPGESDRIYQFSRSRDDGLEGTCVFRTSNDYGFSWSDATQVLPDWNWQYPYVRRDDEDDAAFHLLITGNPKFVEPDDVMYLRYESGVFRRADGSTAADVADLPMDADDVDVAYDEDEAEYEARATDLRVHEGTPYITYIRYEGSDNERHHLVYAYFDDDAGEWVNRDVTVTEPGSEPPAPGDNAWLHPGGITIDPRDETVVYVAEVIDGVFEIRRGETTDGGETWAFESVTTGSEEKKIRPQPVENGTGLFWMSGAFEYHDDWETDIEFDFV